MPETQWVAIPVKLGIEAEANKTVKEMNETVDLYLEWVAQSRLGILSEI